MTAILGTEKGGKNPHSGRKEEGGQSESECGKRRRRARMIQTDNANSRPTNDVLAALFFRLRAR